MDTTAGSWHAKEFHAGSVHAGAVHANYVNSSGAVLAEDVRVSGRDRAEQFEIDTQVEPGTVMVLSSAGQVEESTMPDDKKVAGVVSGGGSLKSGLLLDSQIDAASRQPIALCGKVFCKVEADSSAIEIGDLLTTSAVPGHAMKAADQSRAFGTILGKAMRPLASGRDLIPILVTLQ